MEQKIIVKLDKFALRDSRSCLVWNTDYPECARDEARAMHLHSVCWENVSLPRVPADERDWNNYRTLVRFRARSLRRSHPSQATIGANLIVKSRSIVDPRKEIFNFQTMGWYNTRELVLSLSCADKIRRIDPIKYLLMCKSHIGY